MRVCDSEFVKSRSTCELVCVCFLPPGVEHWERKVYVQQFSAYIFVTLPTLVIPVSVVFSGSLESPRYGSETIFRASSQDT